MTIADAYEAMTSSRPYRLTPLTHEQAVAELEKYSGLQFDPEIVPVLVGLDRDILDRPAERPDELPTMLHEDDLVAASPGRRPRRDPQEGRPRGRHSPRKMLLSAILVGLVIGATAGGQLPRLADLRLKWIWLLGIALAVRLLAGLSITTGVGAPDFAEAWACR